MMRYRSRRVAWGSWLTCDEDGDKDEDDDDEDDDADGNADEELPWWSCVSGW